MLTWSSAISNGTPFAIGPTEASSLLFLSALNVQTGLDSTSLFFKAVNELPTNVAYWIPENCVHKCLMDKNRTKIHCWYAIISHSATVSAWSLMLENLLLRHARNNSSLQSFGTATNPTTYSTYSKHFPFAHFSPHQAHNKALTQSSRWITPACPPVATSREKTRKFCIAEWEMRWLRKGRKVCTNIEPETDSPNN